MEAGRMIPTSLARCFFISVINSDVDFLVVIVSAVIAVVCSIKERIDRRITLHFQTVVPDLRGKLSLARIGNDTCSQWSSARLRSVLWDSRSNLQIRENNTMRCNPYLQGEVSVWIPQRRISCWQRILRVPHHDFHYINLGCTTTLILVHSKMIFLIASR